MRHKYLLLRQLSLLLFFGVAFLNFNQPVYAQDYEQLNFLMRLHYQKFYGDTAQNQIDFQTVKKAETILYQSHAALVAQMKLKNEREILLETLSALQDSMMGYGRDEYNLNGLKSASVLGGGVGVCEHIAPAYAQLLNTINPDFAAQPLLTITRDTNFNEGFDQLPEIAQKFAPATEAYQSELIADSSRQNFTINQHRLSRSDNSIAAETTIPTPSFIVDINTHYATASPAAIFKETKPDHMIVQARINLGRQQVTLYIDPTNPSFWYSDGQVLRNLQEPTVYMLYSPLGQGLLQQLPYQHVKNVLTETQLTAPQLQALQQLLTYDRIAQTLNQIKAQPLYQQSVTTLATPGFRHLFQENFEEKSLAQTQDFQNQENQTISQNPNPAPL